MAAVTAGLSMVWSDLAFLHWPVTAASLRPLIPPPLEIDTFGGSAWVAVVPFQMSDVAPFGLPPLPGLSAFPELNVRTYVTHRGRPGVWFFSLDAANPFAVAVARRWYHLPYFTARMEGDSRTSYRSERIHRNAPPARFAARYAPSGDAVIAQPGSIEHFLVERYCLYAANRRGQLFRGDIAHDPWPLQAGEAEVEVETMANASGITLPDQPPIVHYANRLEVTAKPLLSV